MSRTPKLERWVAAGLIDAGQAEAIRRFEERSAQPRFFQAIVGLGVLAIGIGLVSIVASNWDAIPGRVKIAVDLALVAGLGWLVARWHRRGPASAREAGILVLYGLVLASIALIGQVYQLGGKAHVALGIWTVLTAMLMLSGRGIGVGTVWLAGLQTTWCVWLAWSADGPLDLEELALAGIYIAPLLTLAVGRLDVFRRARPTFARVFEVIAWGELVGLASVGTFAFYSNSRYVGMERLWLGFLIASALTAWVWWLLPRSVAGRAQRWLLVACLILAFVPILVSPGDLDVVAALAFIGLWILVAFTAHRAGLVHLLNLATAVIGIRILVVYFEVFGSLLGTGIGLVTGGVLTLGLVWLWTRSRQRFALRMDREMAE